MATSDSAIRVYVQLAEAYHHLGRYQERDRFLMLAADTAWSQNQLDEAEALRKRILDYNPNHLLKPYPTFGDALRSTDMMAYIQQLRRGYPRERAEELLKGLKAEAKVKGKSDDDLVLPMDAGTMRPEASAPVFTNLAREAAAHAPHKPVAEPKLAPLSPARPPAPIPLREEPHVRPGPQLPPSQQIASPRQMRPVAPANAHGLEDPMMAPNPASEWIGGLLFFVILAVSIVVLGYVFVIPFLPL